MNTLPKPICVIYLPQNFQVNGGEEDAAVKMMNALNGNFGVAPSPRTGAKQTDYWYQYYWFCFYHSGIKDVKFKVYYPKDFTDIQYEELKSMIQKAMEKSNISKRNNEINSL